MTVLTLHSPTFIICNTHFNLKKTLGLPTQCSYLLHTILKRLEDGQCNCTTVLCSILFCSWVRTRKRVKWYLCCLCGHWFSPLFNERKRIASEWLKNGTDGVWNTHTKILLHADCAERLQIFFWLRFFFLSLHSLCNVTNVFTQIVVADSYTLARRIPTPRYPHSLHTSQVTTYQNYTCTLLSIASNYQ